MLCLLILQLIILLHLSNLKAHVFRPRRTAFDWQERGYSLPKRKVRHAVMAVVKGDNISLTSTIVSPGVGPRGVSTLARERLHLGGQHLCMNSDELAAKKKSFTAS